MHRRCFLRYPEIRGPEVYSLFVDVKRSTQFLVDYQNDFMFSELEEDKGEPMDEDMD